MTATEKPGRYVLLQTAVGDYRRAFLQCVFDRTGGDMLLLTGDVYFDGSTKTRVDFGKNQMRISNRYLAGGRAGFQTGHFRTTIKAERMVCEMNPRMLSTWLILVARRVLGRRTCVWGHAWPRKGKEAKPFLRDLMARIAGNVLAYTPQEAEDFKQRLPSHIRVYCAPNALYPANEIYDRRSGTPDRFLYIGRMVEEKKPELALTAYASVGRQMPGSRLTFVGDGPLKEHLIALSKELQIDAQVEFLGHIGDPHRLATLFGESVAGLSPGYVGLSVIQSFSFGTPMIVADVEPHAPEIAAVINGKNAQYFKANDPADLGQVMLSFWQNREQWCARRESIAAECRENYSVERMAEGFLEFFTTEQR